MGPGLVDPTQVFRLGSKYLYSLSHPLCTPNPKEKDLLWNEQGVYLEGCVSLKYSVVMMVIYFIR